MPAVGGRRNTLGLTGGEKDWVGVRKCSTDLNILFLLSLGGDRMGRIPYGVGLETLGPLRDNVALFWNNHLSLPWQISRLLSLV